MDGTLSVIGLLCRTADRSAGLSAGAQALATVVASHADTAARMVGSPGEPHAGHWREDLRASRGCLLEAGGQVDDALAAGRVPLLAAGDCAIAMTTLPTVTRHAADAYVLWLDAHADFNTPETTLSHYLGGMGLAAACGRWDPELIDERLDPARVVMCGVRDVDARERVELERAGVRVVPPSQVGDELDGKDVYVHVDLDVLDPGVVPTTFATAGGLSDQGLRTLLGEVAGVARVVGVEVTNFDAPGDETERGSLAVDVAAMIEPLTRGAVVGR